MYLGGHDDARGTGVNCEVSCHQSHVIEQLTHLPVLLVTEGLRESKRWIKNTLVTSRERELTQRE